MRLTFILLLIVAHFLFTFGWRFSDGLNEPLEVLRDRRAKEISPPSYMKRFEYEPNEQLLQQIWSNVLQRKMLRQRRLLQPLFYLPRGRER